jgi:hypothetical protein
LKKIGLALVLVLLLSPIVFASALQRNGVDFEVPKNWSIADDEWINGTQLDGTPFNGSKIVLTDGLSLIRLDIVSFPQLDWVSKVIDRGTHTEIAETYYRTTILGLDPRGGPFYLRNVVGGGIGSTMTIPIGINVKYTDFYEGREWLMAGILTDRLIGIAAVFNSTYPVKDVGNYQKAEMAMPLYDLLKSISTNQEVVTLKNYNEN